MAREGLRTLVIGRKILSKELYDEFKIKLNAAKLSTVDRNLSIHKSCRAVSRERFGVAGLDGC